MSLSAMPIEGATPAVSHTIALPELERSNIPALRNLITVKKKPLLITTSKASMRVWMSGAVRSNNRA